ncbi:ABC-type glycerol-3-phosphate transport system permease component [Salinibacterium sp. CAN_S4]|uniref:carbohydrate ABC transporter permease n=1 Tax=Salinibacterium sp. CAN_S4 TaxID=2787727 RepID=UPI0018F01B5B
MTLDTRSPRTTRVPLRAVPRHVTLALLAALSTFPIVLILSTALKTPEDVRTNPFGLFSSFSWDNIVQAWTAGKFSEYFFNSVLLTGPTTILVLVISTMGGYAFARLPFRGRGLIFYVSTLGLLVPFFAYMIPLYFQLKTMSLLNTYPGVVLVLTSIALPFGLFFMRAFFLELPNEIEDSARIDGCSEFQIFLRVMLPLGAPGLGTLAIFTALQTWNNFLVPLLFLPGGSLRPLTTGIYLFAGGRSAEIGPLAAGTLITIIPIIVLFIALQRQVVAGFLAGAVKG